MAMNSPETGSSRSAPVMVSCKVIDVRVLSPWISETTEFRELDLGVLERPGGHDLAGPQLVTSVHDSDGLGESGQEGSLLNSRVAAADDSDVLVTEEKPSQVAHQETPCPASRSSSSMPSLRYPDPMAKITVRAEKVLP